MNDFTGHETLRRSINMSQEQKEAIEQASVKTGQKQSEILDRIFDLGFKKYFGIAEELSLADKAAMANMVFTSQILTRLYGVGLDEYYDWYKEVGPTDLINRALVLIEYFGEANGDLEKAYIKAIENGLEVEDLIGSPKEKWYEQHTGRELKKRRGNNGR